MFTQDKSYAHQIKAAFQRKINLYRECVDLTLQIGKAIETENGDLTLSLLKGREDIFDRIRAVDGHVATITSSPDQLRMVGQQSIEINVLHDQIHDLVRKIISTDSDLFKQMAMKRAETLNALTYNHQNLRLARAYRSIGANQTHLVDIGQ